MANSRACIAFQNLVDAAIINASSSILLAQPQNLQTPDVGERWRSAEAVTASFVARISSSFDVIGVEGMTMSAAGQARVRVSSVDTSGAAGDLHDSGWLTVDTAYNRLVELCVSPIASGYVRVDLSDAGAAYVEAGRFIVALKTQFALNFGWGWSAGYASRSIINQTSGGQTKIWRRSRYRVLDVTFSFASPAERFGIIESIDRVNGLDDDVLFIIDPTSASLARDSIWGLVTELTPVTQPNFNIFVKQYKISQRL